MCDDISDDGPLITNLLSEKYRDLVPFFTGLRVSWLAHRRAKDIERIYVPAHLSSLYHQAFWDVLFPHFVKYVDLDDFFKPILTEEQLLNEMRESEKDSFYPKPPVSPIKNEKFEPETTLYSILEKDGTLKNLAPFLEGIQIGDLKILTQHDLRETYFDSPEINNCNVPHCYHLIQYFDDLLDRAIKRYFLPYMSGPRQRECGEDWCEERETEGQDLEPSDLHYSCLRWVCKACYESHQKAFRCTRCDMEQCACHSVSRECYSCMAEQGDWGFDKPVPSNEAYPGTETWSWKGLSGDLGSSRNPVLFSLH